MNIFKKEFLGNAVCSHLSKTVGAKHLFCLIINAYADGSDHNESYVFTSNFLTKRILVRGG